MNAMWLRVTTPPSAGRLDSLGLAGERGDVAGRWGERKTTIRANGRSADMLLIGTHRHERAPERVQDDIATRSALDPSYVTPDVTIRDRDLDRGAGRDPNSSFTIMSTSAHLQLTTLVPGEIAVSLIRTYVHVRLNGTQTFDPTW